MQTPIDDNDPQKPCADPGQLLDQEAPAGAGEAPAPVIVAPVR